jgi:hypothetical protein
MQAATPDAAAGLMILNSRRLAPITMPIGTATTVAKKKPRNTRCRDVASWSPTPLSFGPLSWNGVARRVLSAAHPSLGVGSPSDTAATPAQIPMRMAKPIAA